MCCVSLSADPVAPDAPKVCENEASVTWHTCAVGACVNVCHS